MGVPDDESRDTWRDRRGYGSGGRDRFEELLQRLDRLEGERPLEGVAAPKNGGSSKTIITILGTLLVSLTGTFLVSSFGQHTGTDARLAVLEAKSTAGAALDASTLADIAALRQRIDQLERGREDNRHEIEVLQRDVARLSAGLPARR